MTLDKPKLIVEISDNYCLLAVLENVNNNFKFLHKIISKNNLFNHGMVENFENTCNIISSSIYSIEKEINFTFKEVIIFIDNSYCSICNLTGYKKLNGSNYQEKILYTYLIL